MAFKVSSANNGGMTIEEFVHIYGQEPTTGFASTTPTGYPFNGIVSPVVNGVYPGTIASNISAGVIKPPFTKRWFVDGITMYASEPLNFLLQAGQGLNVWAGTLDRTVALNRGVWVYPGDALGMTIKGRLYPGRGGVTASVGARFTPVGIDREYNAPYQMLILADSNTEGTSLQNGLSQWDVYTWQLKKWLTSQSKNIWLIDKSQASRTTTDYETWRCKGGFELPNQPSIIIYNLGTNDTVLATVQANMANAAAWKQYRYPKSIMIFCGVFPRQNPSNEANNITFRSAANTMVQNLNQSGDNSFYFCDFGSIFNAVTGLDVDGINCYTNDGRDGQSSGTYLHLNAHGQSLAGTALINFIQTNNIHLKIKRV